MSFLTVSQEHLLRMEIKWLLKLKALSPANDTSLVSDGVFIFIGMKPNIELFRDTVC